MKRLTILFCFLSSQCFGGEIKFLQSTSLNGGIVTSASLAYTNPIKGGSLLVAAIRIGATGRTITVSDSNGLWRKAISQNQDTDGDMSEIHYWPSARRERRDTVTVTISGAAATLRYAIHEYAGLGNGSVDVSSGAQKDATAVYQTVPIVVHNGETLLFGLGINDNASQSQDPVADVPFNQREKLNCGGLANCLSTEDRVMVSTGGAYRASFTDPLTAKWACNMVAFRSGDRTRRIP